MRFLNKYVILYIAILLMTVSLYFVTINHFIISGQYNYVSIASIAYAVIIFAGAFLINKKDIYEGYYGFNYHFFTYVICNGLPLVLIQAGEIDIRFQQTIYTTMATWGIGLFIHFIVFMVLRRRSLKGFDKKEIFD